MCKYCNRCMKNTTAIMHSIDGVVCSICGGNYFELIKEKIKKKQKTDVKLNTDSFKDINLYKDLISSVRIKINSIENKLDYVTEEALIDSYIYELKSAKTQHDYLIRKIKEFQKKEKEVV